MVFQTLFLSFCGFFCLQSVPTSLATDFLQQTEAVFPGGRTALIESSRPLFSWESARRDRDARVVLLDSAGVRLWDSGRLPSCCNSVLCGIPLSPSTRYQWYVQTRGRGGLLRSQRKTFRTCDSLDVWWSAYPLDTDTLSLQPALIAPGVYFADFGKDAFSRLEFSIHSDICCSATVHIGEKLSPDGRLDRSPGASIRYASYRVDLRPGLCDYSLELRHDPRNAPHYDNPPQEPPIHMPHHIGEVYPFRYCEIETPATVISITRTAVHYPFDEGASSFVCSDSLLNAIWDLCKYSIKATSFCGYYVDGDRERIPYEADALINQISHYCTDREYAMARRSVDYLIFHPTWPTEYSLMMPLLAWRDYLYTGDKRLIQARYDDLVAKAMIPLRDSRGLISTVGRDTRAVRQAIHYHRPEPFRDIVDWPRVGGFGSPGEDDGYDMRPFNTVVNSFHYNALVMLSKIASALDKQDQARYFSSLADTTARSIVKYCYDFSDGAFFDGIGSSHKSLHATLFPLAFGLVPDQGRALEFIHSKGMVCSVYASQFLLEGLYDARDSDYALSLLTARRGRCWWAMMQEGSTITLEAWSRYYKGNLDWNHAWGAAPANIIPRKILGVEPASPGFESVRINPQIGSLRFVEGTVPTPRGPIHVRCDRRADGSLDCKYSVPPGIKVISDFK